MLEEDHASSLDGPTTTILKIIFQLANLEMNHAGLVLYLFIASANFTISYAEHSDAESAHAKMLLVFAVLLFAMFCRVLLEYIRTRRTRQNLIGSMVNTFGRMTGDAQYKCNASAFLISILPFGALVAVFVVKRKTSSDSFPISFRVFSGHS